MKLKDNIRVYVWIEFLVWFLILFLCILGFRLYQYQKFKQLPSYQIFLPDVDGMIVGSPVRYMGVSVGYIKETKIISNKVYVQFVITKKSFRLPKGIIATVEFNGLGGSKSLELYPPDKNENTDRLIVIKTPTRLHDSLGLLNDMFGKIGSISGKLSHFVNKMSDVDNNKLDIRPENIGENIRQTNDFVDNMIKNRNEFQHKLKEWKHE